MQESGGPKLHQVVDGRIVHANGELPITLQGDERKNAHADVLMAISYLFYKQARDQVGDQRPVDILRRDPSLLLETLPSAYPLKRTGKWTWPTADSVWESNAKWFGNWLTYGLVELDDLAITQLALEVGIHPDDRSVWPNDALLRDSRWLQSPERVQIALRYGADVNARNCPWEFSYLLTACEWIKARAAANKEPLIEAIKIANLLLDGGCRWFEQTSVDPHPDGEREHTIVGLLASVHWPHTGSSRTEVEALLRRAQNLGADINRHSGTQLLPPVVLALQARNISTACQLIEMGCRIDDEHVGRFTPTTFHRQLEKMQYPEGASQIIEALMLRKLRAKETPQLDASKKHQRGARCAL